MKKILMTLVMTATTLVGGAGVAEAGPGWSNGSYRCNPPGPQTRGVLTWVPVFRNFARVDSRGRVVRYDRFQVGERMVCVPLRSGNYVP